MDLNELIPICRVGNRSVSDVKQLLDLYLIRSRSWAPDLINDIVDSKKFLGFSKRAHLPEIFFTHVSMQENLKDFKWLLIHVSWLQCMSGMTVTAFVYATDSNVLKNSRGRHRLIGVFLTHSGHCHSSLISRLKCH